jgi:MFS family permease
VAEESGESGAPWRDIVTRQYGPSLALVCLGVWLHAADGLLVATMMPAIIAEIGGVALIPWTVAVYEIGTIVVGAASGLVAIRHGIRRPMAVAACLFAAGCAMSALAPTMPILLAGRLLQGLGGGGLMALAFVAVGLHFPAHLMARVMGAISTLWAISAFMGPLVGGLFVELATWRMGFWCFAAQATLLAVWLFVRPDDRTPRPSELAAAAFPAGRLVWLCLGVVAIAYAGVEIGALRTPLLVLLGGLCLAMFLWLDGRSGTARLLPQRPLSFRRPLGGALTMILCLAAATVAIGIYVPLLITRLYGITALFAGFIIALESVAWGVVAALVSGRDEARDRRSIILGMALVTASIPAFAIAIPLGPLPLVAVAGILQGAGFGMAWTFILRRATGLARGAEKQLVAAALPTVQRLGYALGAAFIGIVANAAGIEAVDDAATLRFAATAIFLACLPLALVGLVAMRAFVRDA